MTKLLVLAAAATLMLSGAVSAQDVKLKQSLNCHPPSNGAPAWDSQAVEQSVILPSVGGDTTTGAASTVQRHGQSVEVRDDCPPASNAPAAGAPNR